MYHTIAQLIEKATQENLPLHEVILNNECQLTDQSPAQVIQQMHERWAVMQSSTHKALEQAQQMQPPLIAGQAKRQQTYAQGKTLGGAALNQMMALSLSASEVNASMGRICAAPTAGACGILPAVLEVAAQQRSSTETEIVQALMVAAGFGAIITLNATISGAEGGCQAECGTAAAMAAAAAVHLAGGTPHQCGQAVAIALINCMGLICDPVAGLVQLPCSFRNASQSANALASADMALAGQNSVIPPDEVLEAMYHVGKSLPGALRETAEGGIAATPTARKIAKEFL